MCFPFCFHAFSVSFSLMSFVDLRYEYALQQYGTGFQYEYALQKHGFDSDYLELESGRSEAPRAVARCLNAGGMPAARGGGGGGGAGGVQSSSGSASSSIGAAAIAASASTISAPSSSASTGVSSHDGVASARTYFHPIFISSKKQFYVSFWK